MDNFTAKQSLDTVKITLKEDQEIEFAYSATLKSRHYFKTFLKNNKQVYIYLIT